MACQQSQQMKTVQIQELNNKMHVIVHNQKLFNIPHCAGLPVIKMFCPPLWQEDKDIVLLYVI